MGLWHRMFGGGGPNEPPHVDLPLASPPSGELTEAMGDFGLVVARGAAQNVVCSALSVYEAWLRVWAGARGECRDELTAALGLAEVEDVRVALRAVIAAATRPRPNCRITTANAIWVTAGLAIEPAFETEWGGGTREIEFADAESAAATINRWVNDRTDGMIPEVLDARAITAATTMILANAIYLKARWEAPFDAGATFDRPFVTPTGGSVQHPAMWSRDRYPVVTTDDFELLEKRYAGGDVSFVVVLPRVGQFEAVRDGLSFGTVRRALAAAAPVDTVLKLPRFSVSSSPEIDAHLQALGAQRIYDADKADLCGLSSTARERGRELFVGRTTHRARIDVDEEGTEAAAVTVVEIERSGGASQVQPYEFTVDRPFLYFIVERSTATPLFSGHVMDPR